MSKRLISDNYHALAISRGYIWLGPEVPNNRTKTRWKCANGHEWSMSYSDICGGHGCPYCSKHARKTPDDYHALALDRGLEWIGEFVRVTVNTKWRCSQSHEWSAPYHSIRKGNGCPYCAQRVKKTAGDYALVAQLRNLFWLGPLPENTKSLTGWQCLNGHEWQAPFTNINQGSGCPHCAVDKQAQKRRIPTSGYHQIATQRGFIWLGDIVHNVGENTRWQCEHGHVWIANYHNIQSGSGCPYCQDFENGQRVSKVQKELHSLIGGILNYRFEHLWIDVALFIGDDKIAIEYDGYYWHNEEKDAERDMFLIEHSWKILHIRSSQMLPSMDDVQRAISSLLDGSTREEITLEDWPDAS